MVQHDLVPQLASKIKDAKDRSPLKLHFCSGNQILQTLTACNFVSLCGKKTVLPFCKPLINVSLEPD